MSFDTNFVKLYLFHHPQLDLYRIDNDATSPRGYNYIRTMYVLNSLVYPPHPNMTSMTYIFTKTSYPFNTVNITDESYDISLSFNSRRKNQWVVVGHHLKIIMVYTYYCHVARSLPFLYEIRTDNAFSKSLHVIKDMSVHNRVPYYEQRSIRGFFYFDKEYGYWECYPECVCVPSDDPTMYETISACQIQCYSQTYDKHVYVGNSSKMLYEVLKNYNQQTPKKDNILYKQIEKKPWLLSI